MKERWTCWTVSSSSYPALAYKIIASYGDTNGFMPWNFWFHRMEQIVSRLRNKSFKRMKLKFQADETIVSHRWNQSFSPLKLKFRFASTIGFKLRPLSRHGMKKNFSHSGETSNSLFPEYVTAKAVITLPSPCCHAMLSHHNQQSSNHLYPIMWQMTAYFFFSIYM